MVELANKLNSEYKISFLSLYDYKPYIKFKGNYFTLDAKKEYPLYHFPLKIIQYIFRAFKIYQICRKNKFDVIVGSLEETNIPILLSKIIFKNTCKIILSIHVNPKIYLKNPIKKFIIRKTYPLAETVVAVSGGQKSVLETDFNLKNTALIYNLFDEKEIIKKSFEIIPKDEEILFNENTYITVSRLVQSKKIDKLLLLFKKIQNENKRLIILGDGPEKDHLLNIIKENSMEKNVFLLGHKNNPYPYISKAKTFILTSESEAFGMVLVESLILGTPVISTDCEFGPREIIAPELDIMEKITYPYAAKNGILLDKEDPLKNFEQLEELTSNLKKPLKTEHLDRFYSKNIYKSWERIITK
ncbi:N-acetylgalactosamine-N,N'-diacetylbacillosaminyl-diphospho-undecaprenol 4-alpha-N-acetylgalactosaminyltransferase [Methanococcus maripaludis]|uniref:N-acetylgalactosamine-N, N'-diacetylbacillosaminyl-diphospho-undecaprenol 4-alpha-N-acetylgalactosaminyltransferase n=2 Tax=Methanococcus maripaludis TaxID=39152 RepID=A0A8T4H029_METMI|nr:glycosyltransferase [Methanococcus maripaludis]MBM7409118.1 N-acetylgalactosamine-N,N'-diacetylbacillosaminyl-diphospho-undecaprenol 4-alpha-N-acetylgalactosaminyltransferase [Methanococcus maripaludis]MBP2218696.1 N-acetylgalactosamine-N,N'-diacetylbacillosaminyl-diphospho-undecaprenol 4-alpha-N-acetylgalactosaminyltransferase [Methanococcus maripaludis]